MRISAPPMRFPCYLGVDTARQSELIAARMSVEGIRKHIGVDSLGYLSLEGLLDSVGQHQSRFCRACFTGSYPVPVQLEMEKLVLEAS